MTLTYLFKIGEMRGGGCTQSTKIPVLIGLEKTLGPVRHQFVRIVCIRKSYHIQWRCAFCGIGASRQPPPRITHTTVFNILDKLIEERAGKLFSRNDPQVQFQVFKP
jgi:hypothetical protein